MPAGGTVARAAELGTLSAVAHEFFTDENVGRFLAEAEREETDDVHRALLRETRHAYDRATCVPTSLVERFSRATSAALPLWVKARAAKDFGLFAPSLQEILELRREYAAAIDPHASPYAVVFEDYEPWIPLETARTNIAQLRDGLKPIIAKAVKRAEGAPNPFAGSWSVENQHVLGRRVLAALGYDLNHGRLDLSAHPFSTGNVYDARVTTRYHENDVLSGLLSTIHEFGHSFYTLGLPKEHFGTPLGDARDLSVHESQSRLWENHVGRSLPFLEFIAPAFDEAFPGRFAGISVPDAWRAANRVKPSFIRVEADELTYHMHIAVRFEVEEAAMSGAIETKEIASFWNEKMESYLGITPPDDSQGCLQDIHWSHGSFGYFPTYSLGSMLAAQLWESFERENGDYTDAIRRGDFTALRAWLRDRIHRHGKLYKTTELIERATGSKLAPDAFIRYADAKFATGANA